jgi:hypothetical protein
VGHGRTGVPTVNVAVLWLLGQYDAKVCAFDTRRTIFQPKGLKSTERFCRFCAR